MKCSKCNGKLTGGLEHLSNDLDVEFFDNLCTKCGLEEKGINKLYHLSHRIEKNIFEFTPRVPTDRLEGEDDTTPRICLSSTLEGALAAISWSSNLFFNLNHSRLIKVYEFDMDSLREKTILDPCTLYLNRLVGDSLVTNEHWCLENLVSSRSYLIEIYKYLDWGHASYILNNKKVNVLKAKNIKYKKRSEDELLDSLHFEYKIHGLEERKSEHQMIVDKLDWFFESLDDEYSSIGNLAYINTHYCLEEGLIYGEIMPEFEDWLYFTEENFKDSLNSKLNPYGLQVK